MLAKRTTIRDIARAAGVHFATVSRALQDNSRIAPETRMRIRELAKKLRYVPDPMLSALTAYRSQTRATHYQATIAWVTNGFTRSGWNSCAGFGLYLQGAKEKAESLGYSIEEFWLREPGMGWKRASDILIARGITGLILAPQPRPKLRVRLDWQRFSSVALGYTTASPQLHVITNDQFHAVVDTVREARSRGYRRLGLITSRSDGMRVDHAWSGGFLAQQQFWDEKDRLPILSSDGITPELLKGWVERYRPDAIIADSWMIDFLKNAGYRIPEDFGFAAYTLDVSANPLSCCGMDDDPLAIGIAAVETLIGMLNRGERGTPKSYQRILLKGTWRDGKTLPSIQARGSSPMEASLPTEPRLKSGSEDRLDGRPHRRPVRRLQSGLGQAHPQKLRRLPKQ